VPARSRPAAHKSRISAATARARFGGGNANPIFAAFWHTALVRYVDFMDNFLAPTE
jgi:2-methylcitrate dehydratase PrpD